MEFLYKTTALIKRFLMSRLCMGLLMTLTAVGYLALALSNGMDALTEGIREVGITNILLLSALSFLSWFVRFGRWRMFFSHLELSVPMRDDLAIYFAGFSMTMTPAKSGEAVRSLFLAKHGISYKESLAVLVAERFSDFASLAFLALSGLFLFPKAKEAVAIIVLFLALVFLLLRFRLDRLFIHFFYRSAESENKEQDKSSFQACTKKLLDFKIFLGGLILGCVAWGVEGVSLFVILQSLGEGISLLQSVFAFSFSLLIGAVTLLPGGVGGTEASLYEILTHFGAVESAASLATILIRLLTLWLSIAVGSIAAHFVTK
ncbi:lysylphosphatidylglycerol synthase transmembrane domain-containing protein [Estrella lausannensis]|uniref:Putative membrane protein n=1 Tax=Estrella lausannensis TaxID=483423 RepID=A0A0H5DQ46_9BACT|nr:lysylphosphatidylglycerol synthase transmembrane domain-containing protein [Estrella lausannensis]CRX38756.1 putative membrane protein [Estrella lausannensis]